MPTRTYFRDATRFATKTFRDAALLLAHLRSRSRAVNDQPYLASDLYAKGPPCSSPRGGYSGRQAEWQSSKDYGQSMGRGCPSTVGWQPRCATVMHKRRHCYPALGVLARRRGAHGCSPLSRESLVVTRVYVIRRSVATSTDASTTRLRLADFALGNLSEKGEERRKE